MCHREQPYDKNQQIKLRSLARQHKAKVLTNSYICLVWTEIKLGMGMMLPRGDSNSNNYSKVFAENRCLLRPKNNTTRRDWTNIVKFQVELGDSLEEYQDIIKENVKKMGIHCGEKTKPTLHL